MEYKLSALLVDDEENASKLLKKLLDETLFFNDIRSAQSISAAKKELSRFEPDIIFLDIKMPGKDGFSFMEEMPPGYRNHKIVFVTAHDQYAIKAIKRRAFDYLLKPVNRIELDECIIRFIERLNELPDCEKQLKIPGSRDKISRIRVNTRTGTLFINTADILFCKAEGNYTTVNTGKKNYLYSLNLGKVAELLPKNGFKIIGRSYISNIEYITLLDRKNSSITLIRDEESVTFKIPRQNLKELVII